MSTSGAPTEPAQRSGRIPAFVLRGVVPYERTWLVGDILAGLTVAAVAIPEAMGYATIVGTPVVTGLYTILFPSLAFAVFAGSRRLIVGGDSSTAALLAGGAATLATPNTPEYVNLVALIALLTGLLLAAARVLRLGFVADFLSRTVLVGFLAGVGVQVAVAQIPDMLGLEISSTGHTVDVVRRTFTVVGHVSWPTVAVSAMALVIVFGLPKVAPRAPAALVAVAGSIVVSGVMDLAGRGHVRVLGDVPPGLPGLVDFAALPWDQAGAALGVAASCLVVIVAQSSATSRAVALSHGEQPADNADLVGLSAGNLAAGLSGTFVVNGSPTRTAVAEHARAQTQVAQLVAVGVVAVVLVALTGPLGWMPRAVLAAVVFEVAVHLVHGRELADIGRRAPSELFVAVVTGVSVVAFGVLYGIGIAVVVSLLRHVAHSYRPSNAVLHEAAGEWLPLPVRPGSQTRPGLIVYRFNRDLFYANASCLLEEALTLVDGAPIQVRWFVLDASAVSGVDYTSVKVVERLLDQLRAREVTFALARLSPDLGRMLKRDRLWDEIGPGLLFDSLHDAVAAFEVAPPDPQVPD